MIKPLKLFIVPVLFCLLNACGSGNSKTNGYTQQQAACIDSKLKIDDSLAGIRNHACKDTSLSIAIKNYTVELNKLDPPHCPSPFLKALKDHVKAWTGMIAVTDKYPQLRGEMHDLFEQLAISADSTEFKKHLKEIADTWTQVEKTSINNEFH